MVGTQEEGVPHVVTWGHRFQQLVDYKETHGDCSVPYRYSVNPQLGAWVKTQRSMKRKATLGDERKAQLESIGFDWGREEGFPQGVTWGQRFQQLVDYKETHGDCKVPQGYWVNPQLGGWVKLQRNMKRNKLQRNMKRNATLDDERAAQLDLIGFDWGREERLPRAVAWEHHFEQLEDYQQIYGDCNVPQGYSVSPQLGNWVHTQRTMKRLASLGDERETQLNSIGFVWGKNA
jgi:hypothetical protein